MKTHQSTSKSQIAQLKSREREREGFVREINGEIHGVNCGGCTCFPSGGAGAGSDGEEVYSRRQQVLESQH